MKRLLVPALLLAFAVPSFAREVLLGTTKLSHGGDVDTLIVRSCANDNDPGRNPGRRPNNNGRLEAFRFVVTKARA